MKVKDTVLLSGTVGSRLFQLHNLDSDYDVKAVYVPSLKDLLYKCEVHTTEEKVGTLEKTTTYFPLRKFMELLLKCSSDAVFLLYSNDLTLTEDKDVSLFLEKGREYVIHSPLPLFHSLSGLANSCFKTYQEKVDSDFPYALKRLATAHYLLNLLKHYKETGELEFNRYEYAVQVRNNNIFVEDALSYFHSLDEELYKERDSFDFTELDSNVRNRAKQELLELELKLTRRYLW